MKIDILTLFPEMFTPLEHSIVGKAREKGLLDIVFFADNQAFNASDNATLPYSLEDFVEHVIPYNIVDYLEMHISRLHCVSCLALNL